MTKQLPGTTSDAWKHLNMLLADVSQPDFKTLPSTWTRMQKIGLVASYVRDTVWNNIRITINQEAYLAGLSLALALIDYLGGFYYPNASSHEERYIQFVNSYLHQYGDMLQNRRASDLFRDLRSAFFHNLVLTTPVEQRLGRRYVLMARPNISISINDNVELFSLSTFAQKVIDAAAVYLTEVAEASGDEDIAVNFEKRFDVKGGNAAIIFSRDYGPNLGKRFSSEYENNSFPKY